MSAAERQQRKRDRRKAGLVLFSAWIPQAKLDDVTRAVEQALDDGAEKPKGKWMRGADLHPMVNVWGRKWRASYLDGSVRTGTYRGDDLGINMPDPHIIEWLFEEAAA